MSDDRERLPAALRDRIPDDVYVTVVYPGDEPPTFSVTPDDLVEAASRQIERAARESVGYSPGPTQTVRIQHTPNDGDWQDLTADWTPGSVGDFYETPASGPITIRYWRREDIR